MPFQSTNIKAMAMFPARRCALAWLPSWSWRSLKHQRRDFSTCDRWRDSHLNSLKHGGIQFMIYDVIYIFIISRRVWVGCKCIGSWTVTGWTRSIHTMLLGCNGLVLIIWRQRWAKIDTVAVCCFHYRRTTCIGVTRATDKTGIAHWPYSHNSAVLPVDSRAFARWCGACSYLASPLCHLPQRRRLQDVGILLQMPRQTAE